MGHEVGMIARHQDGADTASVPELEFVAVLDAKGRAPKTLKAILSNRAVGEYHVYYQSDKERGCACRQKVISAVSLKVVDDELDEKVEKDDEDEK